MGMRHQKRLDIVILVTALAILATGPTLAAVITVGPNSSNCDHTNLGLAVAFADDGDILVVSTGTWTAISGVNFNINNKSLQITGGFDTNCLQIHEGGITNIAGLGSDTVIEIESSTYETVVLHGLTVRDGDGIDGGGIAVRGNTQLILNGVDVRLNQASNGAGIFLDGPGAALLAHSGTSVRENQATANGGGIHVTGGATAVLDGWVTVWNNDASLGGRSLRRRQFSDRSHLVGGW